MYASAFNAFATELELNGKAFEMNLASTPKYVMVISLINSLQLSTDIIVHQNANIFPNFSLGEGFALLSASPKKQNLGGIIQEEKSINIYRSSLHINGA